ncbi:hypothetical protein P153DRAFT_370068 [Dothidotthia symphoricarpi CBS 119687]|uniref:Uncharacterized protein n=1 Tax=Dothidotthia symphoricarpi CBS 119687 TaxID=1392245 RepID=A0A6A6A3S9_9PLEO|nr:uncharacterized protein P153DRAFT_370068 [Dothidotthia symphoricarpi CBS 119687]KAF2125398.1 hypothetical protein P153DRAFT_370068 [Dothidotthia symphoricarpi CBS 119687]
MSNQNPSSEFMADVANDSNPSTSTKIKEALKKPFRNDSTEEAKGHGPLEKTDGHGHVAGTNVEVRAETTMDRISNVTRT